MLPKISVDKAYFLLVVLIAFSLPFHRNIGNVLLILLSLLWVATCNFKKTWSLLIYYKLPLIFVVVFLLFIIGLIHTQNYTYAFSRIERSLPLLLFPLIIFSFRKLNQVEFIKVLQSYILGVFAASIIALVHGFYRRFILSDMTQVEINNFYIDLPHIFMHHIQFGVYLTIAVICLVYLFFHGKERKHSKIITILLGSYFIIFLIISGGFMATVSLFAASIITLLLLPPSKFKTLLLTVFTVFTLAFTIFLLTESNPVIHRYKQRLTLSFSEIENDKYNYSSTRIGPLLASRNIIEANWLLGVGTGDVSDIMEEEYIRSGLDQLVQLNTHNQYLDFWISFGVVGLFVILASLVFPIYLSIKSNSYLYLGFLIVISLCLVTENLLSTNKTIFLYAFFNSIFAFHMVNPKANYEANYK